MIRELDDLPHARPSGCVRHRTLVPGRVPSIYLSSFLRCSGEYLRFYRPLTVFSLSVAYGVRACMEHRRFRVGNEQKSTVKNVARQIPPTYLTVTCSPTSQNACSGLKTQRRTLQPQRNAAPGKPNDISAAKTGPATQSPPSFPKSSNVMRCATSGSRRVGRGNPC